MLNTNVVIDLLSKEETLAFEKIWTKVKKDLLDELNSDKSEARIKADFYVSLLQDERLIMLGNNVWSLKSNYNLHESEDISKKILGDELQRNEEELNSETEDLEPTEEIELELEDEEE